MPKDKNTQKISVITAAQSFGYGPSSKLVTIAKEFRKLKSHKFNIDFYGERVSLTYINQNRKLFDQVQGFDQEIDINKYSLVVSVMEPILAIRGAILGKPVIYVDSLYWFWQWKNEEYAKLEKIVQSIKKLNSVNKLNKFLKDVDDHHLQYIAHRLATVSLVQSFGRYNKNNKDIFRKNIKVTFTNPIIDTSLKDKRFKKDTILISLSGMLSPLVDMKGALRYVRLIFNLFDEFLNKIPKSIKVYLTTNPDVVSRINFGNKRIKVVSFSNEDILKTLNHAIVSFAPVGITFLYESLNYDVPIIFLPEQHDGHFPNYLRLLKKDQKLEKLKKIFPELLFNTRINRRVQAAPDKEILSIQNLINKHYNSNNVLVKNIKTVLHENGKIITDKKYRKNLLRLQKKQLLKRNTSNFKDTVEEILDRFFSLCYNVL